MNATVMYLFGDFSPLAPSAINILSIKVDSIITISKPIAINGLMFSNLSIINTNISKAPEKTPPGRLIKLSKLVTKEPASNT